MNTKKLMTLLLAFVLVLSLAACGAKGGDHMDSMDNEPKNAEAMMSVTWLEPSRF